MQLPQFSVIIPTYARPVALRKCLQSLSRLGYPHEGFEVIVVDDGSPAPLDEIIESFRDVIDVKLIRQRRAGPAAARNTGALHAEGELLAFTDDDCLPEPAWLQEFAKQFSSTPDNLVGGRTINALSDNPCSAASQAIIDVVYSHFNTKGKGLFFASNNFAVAAESFRQAGGFNERFRTSEDREFCQRWTHQGHRMVYASDAVCYHAHDLHFWSFMSQHFGYGRGAFRFHQAKPRLNGSGINPDLRFYFRLISQPFLTESGHRKLLLPALVGSSQLASAAGFAFEAFKSFTDGVSGKSVTGHVNRTEQTDAPATEQRTDSV
jgi:glycosyltransferase involved in cell wall biosynthesis